jgi:hypothetical protein
VATGGSQDGMPPRNFSLHTAQYAGAAGASMDQSLLRHESN